MIISLVHCFHDSRIVFDRANSSARRFYTISSDEMFSCSGSGSRRPMGAYHEPLLGDNGRPCADNAAETSKRTRKNFIASVPVRGFTGRKPIRSSHDGLRLNAHTHAHTYLFAHLSNDERRRLIRQFNVHVSSVRVRS